MQFSTVIDTIDIRETRIGGYVAHAMPHGWFLACMHPIIDRHHRRGFDIKQNG